MTGGVVVVVVLALVVVIVDIVPVASVFAQTT